MAVSQLTRTLPSVMLSRLTFSFNFVISVFLNITTSVHQKNMSELRQDHHQARNTDDSLVSGDGQLLQQRPYLTFAHFLGTCPCIDHFSHPFRLIAARCQWKMIDKPNFPAAASSETWRLGETQEGGHIRASIYTQKATQPYRAGRDVRPRLNSYFENLDRKKISQSQYLIQMA